MKVKFNVVDGLIVLILLVAILGGVVLLGGRNGSAGGNLATKNVRLQVEIADQTEEFSKLPQEGDTVAIGVKEKMHVTVTKVEVSPAVTTGKDLIDGKVTLVEIPNRYDVLISLEGAGVESDATVEIDGVAARVGEVAVLKSKNWAGIGYFMAVETE